MSTRRVFRFLLVLSLSVYALTVPLHGQASASIAVDTADDVIAADGLCSLREAIVAANTDSPFSDCPGGSGADTLVLDSGVLQTDVLNLSIDGRDEDDARTGDLDIVGELTITATTPVQLDGQGLDRVFHVLSGAHLSLSGLTIRGGNPGAGSRGGGIEVLGRLTLSNATVDLNQGGGIHVDGGRADLNNVQICDNDGAGIRVENLATLTYDGGEVCRNQGGGIYGSASTIALSHVDVTGNTGSSGVYSSGSGTRAAVLTINACTISDNSATNGGGVFSQGINARATINDSEFSLNRATSAGGGVFNNGLMTVNRSTIRDNQARSGGGIDHFGGNLYLTNSTISGNDAGDNGGGLHNRGTGLLTNVTFSGNTADGPDTGGNIFTDGALVSLVNSIVALSPTDGNCFSNEGSIQSLGHNLEDANNCGFGAAGDMQNVDPRLGPLQDNGGPTWTHALLSGSPAIGAGDNSECPDTDQRGIPRPQGTTCDIGAYEATDAAKTADLSIEKTRVGTGTVASGDQITCRIGLSNAGPAAPVGAVVVDTWSPPTAVTGVDAPGCTVDLAAGSLTCSYAALELGNLTPEPVVVLTTDPAFTGVLSNTATIAPAGGAIDANPSNNTSQTISVTIAKEMPFAIYLPLVACESTAAATNAD